MQGFFSATWSIKRGIPLLKKSQSKNVAVKQIEIYPGYEKYVQHEIYLHWYLSQSQDNKHIIKFLGWYRANTRYAYIVMELASLNLREHVSKGSALDLGLKKHLTISVVQGIKALHSIGIAYRNPKPEHVLLIYQEVGNPLVKLCDFEFSEEAIPDPELTPTVAIGTPHYLAPELINTSYIRKIKSYETTRVPRDLLLKADIWALGKLIYFIWFEKDSSKERIETEYRNLTASELPELTNIIQGCLHDDPTMRFDIYQLYDQLYFE